MTSDPTTPDRDRRGADLLARIDELTTESKLADYPDGNGWRFLLLACKREVARLTRERDEARKSENTQCDLRYMETEHRERLEQEISAVLDAIPAPYRVRVREGWGNENPAKSLAVSVAKLVDALERSGE